jgi:rifampicin phosphotransferase
MTFDPNWTPANPGPWMQDRAHNPQPNTLIAQEIYPAGFNRGFEETCMRYGALIDRLAMSIVNGYTYHQPQPFDMPGPNGPKTPEELGAEFGRRVGVATHAFDAKIWNDDLTLWDNDLKPNSVRKHTELYAVELESLSSSVLCDHVERCAAHLQEMVYQHHRFNLSALVPVGDFVLQTSGWTGIAPAALFDALSGFSPISSLASPEVSDAITAIKNDPTLTRLVEGEATDEAVQTPAERLAELCKRSPEVRAYVAATGYRLVEGFDVTRPTFGECPELILGKLAGAIHTDPNAAINRSIAYAAEVRKAVPTQHQQTFDSLLHEARNLYRLRDERGIFSDVSGFGLLRLAMLEVGRRLVATGRLTDAEEILDVTYPELLAMIRGSQTPTSSVLQERAADRAAVTIGGSPRFLGPPMPEPPSTEGLPPAMARLMSAVGFMIDSILGELPEASGDASTIHGLPVGTSVYEGRAHVVHNFDDMFDMEAGDVLVTPATSEAFNAMIHLVGAIVTDHGSIACHAAIMARELGFPAVVGTTNGSHRIVHGSRVRVDGRSGLVTVLV